MRSLPLLFLLFAAVPAAAQVKIGDPAPELPPAPWVRPPRAEQLADLRGRVVVLHVFYPDRPGAKPDLERMVELWRHWYRKDVVFLAVSKEPRRAVERLLEQVEVPYGVAAVCDLEESYGIDREWLYLLGHDGRVAWQDWFDVEALASQIEAAVRRADAAWLAWDPGERIEELAVAVDHCRRRRLGKAWSEAERRLRALRADPDGRAAVEAFLADLAVEAGRREARAAELAADGRYFLALEFLDAQRRLWKGSPPGERMDQTARAWRRDRQVKKLIEWDRQRVAALETIYDRGNPGKGRQELSRLLRECAGTALEPVLERDLRIANL
ncbi:MAG: hypothetical protein D6702_12015 [Planctomycetota bacterium]|nr:MAG: hypothetical protein D6702_12015 [Planctomycetota bacterium]